MLIVTGSDDRYAIGVMMLIASASLHNPSARFAVLDLNISEENRRRLANMAQALGIEITLHEVSPDQLEGLHIVNQHINIASYMRLLIPEIFSQVEKLIYMDCDMLCTGSLKEAFDVELGDHLVAAVRDPSVVGSQRHADEYRETGVPKEDYINAGFLVINMRQWREENIHLKCLELSAKRKLRFEDQSAINIACKGRKIFLHDKFNFLRRSGQAMGDSQMEHPHVIHYTGRIKPWMDSSIGLAGLWLAYAERFNEFLPKFEPSAAKTGRLARWNYQRKLFTYRIIDPSKARRLDRLKVIENNIVRALKGVGGAARSDGAA